MLSTKVRARPFHRLIQLLILLVVLTMPSFGFAQEPKEEEEVEPQRQLQLVMTGSNRAIVVLEGERLVLSVGNKDTPGIELLKADSERAILSIEGDTVTLRTGEIAAPVLKDTGNNGSANVAVSDKPKKITLWADETGFFFARGKVGRSSARFLVDTGANTVTFSSQQADAMGIKYQDGQNAFASTASGIAPIKTIVLKKLTIEGISLRNIEANVVLGNFPEVPLLGGSFLNQLNMVRTGKKMELSKY